MHVRCCRLPQSSSSLAFHLSGCPGPSDLSQEPWIKLPVASWRLLESAGVPSTHLLPSTAILVSPTFQWLYFTTPITSLMDCCKDPSSSLSVSLLLEKRQ
jgi:hypothetical protein